MAGKALPRSCNCCSLSFRYKGLLFLLVTMSAMLVLFIGAPPRLRSIVHMNQTIRFFPNKWIQSVLSDVPDPDLTQQPAVQHRSDPQHHVFFLKVHKAASTTVMNLLYRFSLLHDLNVMLPKQHNILSESNKAWRQAAIDLPPGLPYFDILCNHLIFDEPLIRSSLHPNSTFIAIVREPLAQFVSAFKYYSRVYSIQYLINIPGPDPLLTYMQSPDRWEPRDFGSSYTHNRMSFDFGMELPGLNGNRKHIRQYISYLNKTFDLVMVSERFDESMVLLKRLLGWQLQDVLYIKNNVFNQRKAFAQRRSGPEHNFTAQEKQIHRWFNAADYALYEHFSTLFQKKVEAEGTSFADEVSTYRTLRQKVAKICAKPPEIPVSLEPTKWSKSFQISRTDCELMTLMELRLVDIMRREQMKRLLNNPLTLE